MAITQHPLGIRFSNVPLSGKKIQTYVSNDDGNTWNEQYTEYSNNRVDNGYHAYNYYNAAYELGSYGYRGSVEVDEDGNTHILNATYYDGASPTLNENFFTTISYSINGGEAYKKTFTSPLFNSGQLRVEKIGPSSYVGKFFTIRGSGSTTVNLYVINFNISGTTASYSSTETYTLNVTTAVNKTNYGSFQYVHKSSTGEYLIGSKIGNYVYLIRYDGNSTSIVTTSPYSSSSMYDMVITDNYFAYTNGTYGRTRPIIYKIESDSWILSPTGTSFWDTYPNLTCIRIIDTKIWWVQTYDYYDEVTEYEYYYIILGYWDIEKNDSFWNGDVEVTHFSIPQGNSRVGYFVPIPPEYFDEMLLTIADNETDIEMVGLRITGSYWAYNVTTGPADIMYIKFSLSNIGTASVGKHAITAGKTKNKYGRTS